jgi:hypothetical protein
MGKAIMKDKVFIANLKTARQAKWPLERSSGAKAQPK